MREPYFPPLLLIALSAAALAWESPAISDTARSVGRIPAAALFTALTAALLGTVFKALLSGRTEKRNPQRI